MQTRKELPTKKVMTEYLVSQQWVELPTGDWTFHPKEYKWMSYKILSISDAYALARHCDPSNKFTLPIDDNPWD